MKILITDINKRIRTVDKYSNNLINMRESQIYTSNGIFCQENAINSIRNWESLSDTLYESYIEALNIFDAICENCNVSIINSCADILIESESKVRDQTQLANSLKYRIARFKKNKTTKIAKVYNDVTEKIKAALTVKPVAAPIATTTAPAKNNNTEVASECYNKIYQECLKNKECDRIINNYNNISKRFNIDKMISEVTKDSELYDFCATVAKYIDTYNSPFKNKYNTALEVASYAMDKYYMDYPKEKIIEAVTDYFIFSGSIKKEQYEDVKSIMEISVLFEQSDFSSLSWMMDENNNYNNNNIDPYIYESYGVPEFMLEKNNIIKDIKDSTKKLIKDAKTGNPDERKTQEIKQMVDEFRKKCTEDPDNKSIITNLKALIYKIFAKSPEQIIDELPNFFGIFRLLFISSTLLIHPIVALITFITSEILKLHFTRKQLDRVIKSYKKEIDNIKTKIEKSKDEKQKERLEKYLEALKKDLEKLEYYEKDLYTDEENDQRDEEKYASGDYGDIDDDWDFNDDDWDVDFEEMGRAILMSDIVQSISESLIDDTVDGIVYNNIFKLDDDSIDSLTDFSITVPVILEKEKLKESLVNYRNQLRKSAKYTKDYMRIDCLNENIYKLETSNRSYNTSNSSKDILNYLFCLKEFTKINSDYITEMEFSNTIKMAINKLQKDAIKLSDKEKQVSSIIDVSANNIAKKLEDSVKTNNRESIIRGSIIPSASKCIKLALIYGTAWCISPAIAIISAIGHFACSKAMQKKERQLILDDIDIELKMCDRYISDAENKNDLKKIRELEKIKRNLIRQKQRITYKMITVYHEPIVKANDGKNDD